MLDELSLDIYNLFEKTYHITFIPRREERSEPNGVHLTAFPI